jgi:activating signal cointegrator complex subunit 3
MLFFVFQDAQEFSDLPVRHNEDIVNSELAKRLPFSADSHSYDSSHTKTFLLIQAHLERCPLPSADYHTDTKSVLDQVLRILQVLFIVCYI